MEMLTASDLAAILRIKVGSLRVRLSRRPDSLPTPTIRGRGTKTLWLKSDVENWVLSNRGKTHGSVE